MISHFFKILFLVSLIWLLTGEEDVFAQKQNFETNFQPSSFPQEFLPDWYGNEVSISSARIFQISGQGKNGSKALAVQPISTFNGKIWIRLYPQEFENPEILFFARSLQNGSGTRPALVFYSWGKSLDSEFTPPVQMGEDSEFANENQEFRKFRLLVPEELKSEAEVILILEIRYGLGSGSAARWIMDDFEFGDFAQDTIPPKVSEVKGFSEKSLLLRFSEKIDPVFSTFPIAYELDGQNPESVELKQDSLLELTFSERFESNRSYSITIRQIPDLEGNFLRDTTVNFAFYDPTSIQRKELVINELMPAPRSDQDLPNVEYIELYHSGEQEFRMEGMRLSNSRTETALDEFWLKPGEYLILVPENQDFQFMEFGSVLPVKNWPTLLNSGDRLTLKSSKGVEIDQVSFATSSWNGSEFANGGYSLEVPNPYFLCDNTDLLKPSVSALRGTPGSQNSILNQDVEIIPPKFETAYFKDSLWVFVDFSRPILRNLTIENLSFYPSLEIDSLIFLSEREIRIFLKSPGQSNQLYELSIFGIIDCLGNPIPEQKTELILAENPLSGDLIINEILFNPRTGDPKFVEVRNTSQKYLSLEKWALANISESGSPNQIRIFGASGLIIEPGGYLAITTDAQALKNAYPKSFTGNFLQIPTLPSYPTSGGTVALISSNGEIAETFIFNEDLHHPLLRDPKGVSLERISPSMPSTSLANWQSASGTEGFATPGRKNSNTILGEFDSEVIQIEPDVFDPEGSYGPTFTSIRYELDQSAWVGTFKIYSSSGQLIQTLAQNQILGTNGLLTWTGTDGTGKMVRAGYYILVVELYEPNGVTKLIKRTIVVATRL